MNLKQFKPVHWLYNLLNYKSLRHNKAAYKKYNVQKPLIASISSKDFPDKESRAWLDTGDSASLAPQKESFAAFPAPVQQQLKDWSSNGYLILENFFDAKTVDAVNAEIDQLQQRGKLSFTYGNKLMFANKKSKLIKSIAEDPGLKKILSFILDKDIVAFQTINFINGSEQRAHSDSIHMTTYPLGYLIAAWIALEDVTHDNGPLFYFPGSHQLPYLLNNDFNEGATFLTLGKKDYVDYEDVIEDLVKQKNYSRKEFLAKKGDVLIWHANLVHGGAPILDKNSTRKSMVVHYYATDVIKYHEITERPSLI
jgi:ectoine hydroxylase-related dioxygenase (phytanoyl-CoA dioxygenase family)